MQADAVWFLARDMDIVYQVFRAHYKDIQSSYVHVSRAAMMQLNIRYYPQEFFQYYFHAYMLNGTLKISQILSEVNLKVLKKYLHEEGLNEDQIFNADTYEAMRRVYLAHIDAVCKSFSNAVEGAKAYFRSLAGECKRICVVDLGWNGTIMVELSRFFKHHGLDDIALEYVLLGAANTQTANDLQISGKLHTYVFSGLHDKDLQLDVTTLEGNTKIMCLEALFSADAPTLASYGLNADGQPCFKFGAKTEKSWQIEDIQHGILDFVAKYMRVTRKLAVDPIIFPRDAFAPYLSIASDFAYQYLLFSQVLENEDGMAVTGNQKRLTTLGQIMEKRGLL